VVKSWLSNGRHLDGSKEPSFETVTIQGNANVAVLSKSINSKFGWWLRVSTLEKGKVAYLPFDIHPYGENLLRHALKSGGKLSTGVTLNRRNGIWSAQLCVTEKVSVRKKSGKRGVDVGMVKVLADSTGNSYGSMSGLMGRKKADSKKAASKQKLNACLKKKNLEPLPLVNGKTERWVRNVARQAMNDFIEVVAETPLPPRVILEKLSVYDMRMKSRDSNRMLKAGQLSFIAKEIRRKLDLAGIAWEEVHSAYSSQECPNCGFTIKQNRPSQAIFRCLACEYTENADTKAAIVIEGRSGDDAINAAPYRLVGTILAERFIRRWHGGCPPSVNKPSESGSLVDELKRRKSKFLRLLSGSSTSSLENNPLSELKPKHLECLSNV
jgi:putative transposase